MTKRLSRAGAARIRRAHALGDTRQWAQGERRRELESVAIELLRGITGLYEEHWTSLLDALDDPRIRRALRRELMERTGRDSAERALARLDEQRRLLAAIRTSPLAGPLEG